MTIFEHFVKINNRISLAKAMKSGFKVRRRVNIRLHDVTMEFHVHPMAEHVAVVVVSPSSNRCPPKLHA